MFENLIESKPKKERSWKQMILSAIVHSLMFVGAIYATKGAAEVVQKVKSDSLDVFVSDAPPPPPPPPAPPPPDAVVVTNPPPLGFQTITPPRDIPTTIPPIDLTQKFDAKDYSGRGVEGGISTGIVGGSGPVITNSVVVAEVFRQDEVEEPATRTGGPDPRYPEGMKAVGIEGNVLLEFVVGTNGRAEAGSIKVLSSTNKMFEAEAIRVIQQSRFSPAKMRGTAVRQVVQQNVRFQLIQG